jgi:selenocysteine-specific elongation factor
MIIGTAGHIDHGKSALAQALTGRALDPFAEERRRGITLDLHFAPLALADGTIAGVVDVPGHEDLIRTMVAGAAGLDLVLLVIAADEGIMPQTREHLAIVEQLRVPRGIPVLTKADLVEPEWLDMVAGEVSQWLAASPVAFDPPVVTSAATGEGLADLRRRIEGAPPRARPRDPQDLFRLPVDRALSLPGAGTVVTGTAWSGRLRVGDQVRLLPSGLEGRVRSLERHGAAVEASAPAERIAVALAGVDREAVRRGDDVALDLLPRAPRPLAHHSRVRLHLGTAEAIARVQAARPVHPGASGLVRLALESPLVARGGDRFVLRSYSPVDTIGGGWVVDPLPPHGRAAWPEGVASVDPSRRLVSLVARRRQGLRGDQLPVILGVSPDGAKAPAGQEELILAEGCLVAAATVSALAQQALEQVRRYHREHPAEPGLPLETLRQFLGRHGPAGSAGLERALASGRAMVDGGHVREPEFQPRASGGDALLERAVAAIVEAGLAPPSVTELEGRLGRSGLGEALRLAARQGRVVAVERDRYWSPAALAQFREVLARLGARGPFAPPAVREETGLSRKFLIPLLEWADRAGVTVRQGDARVLAARHT